MFKQVFVKDGAFDDFDAPGVEDLVSLYLDPTTCARAEDVHQVLVGVFEADRLVSVLVPPVCQVCRKVPGVQLSTDQTFTCAACALEPGTTLPQMANALGVPFEAIDVQVFGAALASVELRDVTSSVDHEMTKVLTRGAFIDHPDDWVMRFGDKPGALLTLVESLEPGELLDHQALLRALFESHRDYFWPLVEIFADDDTMPVFSLIRTFL